MFEVADVVSQEEATGKWGVEEVPEHRRILKQTGVTDMPAKPVKT